MLNSVSANGPNAQGPLLQAIGITKLYGTFPANNSIDLDLYAGEIHALLGENGAGKSTLVKIMYGLIQPTSGELRWMGEKLTLAGPSDARAHGIAMVFQHFSLFDNLTVAENVALGLDGSETFAAMSARLAQVSRDYGLPLDPNREVWRLSVGERQRIEIVRALMQNPKLLILDEPTAVLTPQEADQLFIVLGRLKSEGRALLYISHKLDEVKRLCDTATILRARQESRDLQPARGNRGVPGAHDGRRRDRRSESRRRPGHHHSAASHQRPVDGAGRSARRLSQGHFGRSQRRRNPRHRRRRRQRPGRIVLGLVGRAHRARMPTMSSSTATPPAICRSPNAAAWAPPSCRKNGSATAPRRA